MRDLIMANLCLCEVTHLASHHCFDSDRRTKIEYEMSTCANRQSHILQSDLHFVSVENVSARKDTHPISVGSHSTGKSGQTSPIPYIPRARYHSPVHKFREANRAFINRVIRTARRKERVRARRHRRLYETAGRHHALTSIRGSRPIILVRICVVAPALQVSAGWNTAATGCIWRFDRIALDLFPWLAIASPDETGQSQHDQLGSTVLAPLTDEADAVDDDCCDGHEGGKQEQEQR